MIFSGKLMSHSVYDSSAFTFLNLGSGHVELRGEEVLPKGAMTVYTTHSFTTTTNPSPFCPENTTHTHTATATPLLSTHCSSNAGDPGNVGGGGRGPRGELRRRHSSTHQS